MDTYILYHANCSDGLCAAAIVSRFLSERESTVPAVHKTAVTALPVLYGERPPEMAESSCVYIVDFCYPAATLLELAETRSVFVYDHHISSQKAFAEYVVSDKSFSTHTSDDGSVTYSRGNLSVCFNNKESGASLVWKTLYATYATPRCVTYVADRDLWKFENAGTDAFSMAARLRMKTVEEWVPALYSDSYTDSLRRFGQPLLEYREHDVYSQCERAVPWCIPAFEDVKAVQLNCSAFMSEVGHALCESGKADIALMWYVVGDVVHCSLRGNGTHDVSVIAASFGGGGHKNAAGFKCKLEQLYDLFYKRT